MTVAATMVGRRGFCEMGDTHRLDDNSAVYEPCEDFARHTIVAAGGTTRACRRHAEEVREVADDISPPLRLVERHLGERR